MTPVRVGLKLHTRTCRASICLEAMQSHDLDSFLRHPVNSRSLPETPLYTQRPMAAPAGGRQYRQAAANSSFSMRTRAGLWARLATPTRRAYLVRLTAAGTGG